jgi:hypothetical protein
LAEFVAEVFASVTRKVHRTKGDCYLRGLMLDGRRKPIQAMAARLPDGNEHNLQQEVEVEARQVLGARTSRTIRPCSRPVRKE